MMRNYGDLVEEEGKPSSEYQREQDFANGKDGGQAFSRGGLGLIRTLFVALTLMMTIVIIVTCVTAGTPFNSALLTPWMKATLVDFYFNVFVLICWIVYKEESLLGKIVWPVLLVCFGAAATCLYVVVQLFKLNPGCSMKDVLLRNGKSEQSN
mmetsp:Transcript_42649/g.100204  ORF Transcript_42649/g.100204 Transcript_42649/m.100204 type:complete len:153 (-) Transcript_42649:1133-1591(-)